MEICWKRCDEKLYLGRFRERYYGQFVRRYIGSFMWRGGLRDIMGYLLWGNVVLEGMLYKCRQR